MLDFYEPVKRSMFRYFCRHHSEVVQQEFCVPKRIRIKKHCSRATPKRIGEGKGSQVPLGRVVKGPKAYSRFNCKIAKSQAVQLREVAVDTNSG